ncbi:PIN domain-containing protein [Methylocystis sp. JR02]|uniref:PIN domain-containing protein n=1 Tax=Methylocystis sp. JR02 TaxID=3046284 RepID=UPI0024B8A140|nr:PIN domain-containing protein [Methylocystis sp. JR02]MDJ0448820.1 PIN domain-containing protein [Methylocystis sp. JR02]
MAEADVARIVALGVPVLCFDTCTALDLMRDPTREAIKAHERRAALDLLSAIENLGPPALLMAEQVQREFNENADGVEEDARAALRKLKAQIQRIDEIAAVYGAVGLTNLDHLNNHVIQARQVADRWIRAAALVRPGADIPSRAVQRVLEARTPAKKGKDSTKDCVVIETYLDVVTGLRAAGLSAPIVFVSSNVKDYAEGTGTRLHSDLASEFASLALEFAPNLAAAKHFLGL